MARRTVRRRRTDAGVIARLAAIIMREPLRKGEESFRTFELPFS